LFIADIVGGYDLDYVGGDGTTRAGSQFAENDPGALVSVLGYVTERLGIAIPVPCEDVVASSCGRGGAAAPE
jgi:hypothetical protein